MNSSATNSIYQRILAAIIDFLAPRLSIRRQFLELTGAVLPTLFHEGLGSVARRTYGAFKRYGRTGSLIIPPPPPPAPVPPVIPPYPYAEWVVARTPTAETLAIQGEAVRQYAYQPRISIITPVYNPPLAIFELAIRSVQQQTYPHWQLCLANGGDAPEIRAYIDQLVVADQRVRAVHLAQNLGIAGNSNAALALADGEFVGFLDHDDKFAPTLLYAVVTELNRDATIDIVYFDEDKISADDRERSEPWFKPAWSPDMMLSVNLLGHGVFRRRLIEECGGFDPATSGAQDWDLALRCSLLAQKIVHVPQMLYHWRKLPGSTAGDAQAKPWVFAAQEHALRKHLAALGANDATVQLTSSGAAVYFSAQGAKISIIIPTKDRFHFIHPCVSSLLHKTCYPNLEIIIVDTGSTAPEVLAYYAELANETRIHLVHYQGDFNYSRANNIGAQQASGDVLLFLNNDTEVFDPNWLETMAGWAMRQEIGVVGAKLLRDDGSIQHAGVIIGLEGHASHLFDGLREGQFGMFGSVEWVRNYMAVTGACLMVRREVFAQIGMFDEEYELVFSDVELGLRSMAAGYRNVWLPFVRLLHHEGGTRGYHMPGQDVARATHHMWQLVLAGDPYFHPELSTVHRHPALASPTTETRLERFHKVLDTFHLLPQSLSAAESPSSAELQNGSLPDEAEVGSNKPIDATVMTAIVKQIQAKANSPIPLAYQLVDIHAPAIQRETLKESHL
ncbi:MAG: glycosyltransferase family 2 protein [Caldilineaceae bacterium]